MVLTILFSNSYGATGLSPSDAPWPFAWNPPRPGPSLLQIKTDTSGRISAIRHRTVLALLVVLPIPPLAALRSAQRASQRLRVGRRRPYQCSSSVFLFWRKAHHKK